MSGNDPWAKHKAAAQSEAPQADTSEETPTVETSPVENQAVEKPAVENPAIESPAVESPVAEKQAKQNSEAKTRKTMTRSSSEGKTAKAASPYFSQSAASPDALTCPKCHQILTQDGRNWRCADGHSYDTAKQGYVNLLLVDQKKSKHPGDDMDMVRARAEFLDAGYYQPISGALNQMVSEQMASQGPAANLLDIGCGDGWYTANLKQALSEETQITGLDISRDAVKYATRRSKAIRWIVASGARPPVPQHSQNAIVTLFTPLMPQGLDYALAENGFVMTASTGPRHLSELRERIYTDVRDEFWSPVQQLQDAGFDCVAEQPVNFRFRPADTDALINLLNMTPHRWKVSPDKVTALKAQDTFEVEADVTLHCFRRKNRTHDQS